jgi:hypothetical protein
MKTTLKLKINPIRFYLGLNFYPIKPSAGLFVLIKSCETIPLNLDTLCYWNSFYTNLCKSLIHYSKFIFCTTSAMLLITYAQ